MRFTATRRLQEIAILYTHNRSVETQRLTRICKGDLLFGSGAERSDPGGDSIAFAPKIDGHVCGAEASNESRQ